MLLSPQNSFIEIPTPNVMTSGGGASGRLGGWNRHEWDSHPYKREPRGPNPFRHVGTQGEGTVLFGNQKVGPHQTDAGSAGTFIFNFQPPEL